MRPFAAGRGCMVRRCAGCGCCSCGVISCTASGRCRGDGGACSITAVPNSTRFRVSEPLDCVCGSGAIVGSAGGDGNAASPASSGHYWQLQCLKQEMLSRAAPAESSTATPAASSDPSVGGVVAALQQRRAWATAGAAAAVPSAAGCSTAAASVTAPPPAGWSLESAAA